jgi:hypothetical protein
LEIKDRMNLFLTIFRRIVGSLVKRYYQNEFTSDSILIPTSIGRLTQKDVTYITLPNERKIMVDLDLHSDEVDPQRIGIVMSTLE